jgi:YVTN family beta-propeller protein
LLLDIAPERTLYLGVKGVLAMRNSASVYSILSRVAAITLAWRRAFLLGLLGVMLGSTPAGAQPFAYVTNFGSPNIVSVINAATNTVVATVQVGINPSAVAITPDGTHAYVANAASNTVSVIGTATNMVVATVPVGNMGIKNPQGVAITPDGTHAYVTSTASNTVTVIATATNTVVATVPVGINPSAVAITPDGTDAYVTDEGSNTVSVIATANNTVVATVPVGVQPVGVAITPDGTHAYVTSLGSTTVSVIDTATNSVAAIVAVGGATWAVAITPDGAHAYVTNVNGVNSVVLVIDTATNTVVATVTGAGFNPVGVAITLDGTLAYVTSGAGNQVSVIDTATNTVLTTLSMNSPVGVAITQVKFACPLSHGFWHHLDTWPVTSLALGSQIYAQAELLTLLDTPPGGDASVILAHQLIAAKLNIAHGSNPASVSSTIADADALLSQFSGKLPYTVSTSSAIGQQMVNDAKVLDRYNNGNVTPVCQR